MIVFALDYDGTYTADPALWDAFIANLQARGHKVMIVTMRRMSEPVPIEGVPVVYTARAAKVPFVAALGLKVDIWIDDNPHWLLSDSY